MQQRSFYIGSKEGNSGICLYTRDFYEEVLRKKGYTFISSSQPYSAIRQQVMPEDAVHMEVGIFQQQELQILFRLLDDGYKNVSITMHDPPLLRYPYYQFKNAFFNKVSKFFDIQINHFQKSRAYISRLKAVYVLTQQGVNAVEKVYGARNVYFLPHIIREVVLRNDLGNNHNFIYVGFIGRNKGIGYALELHQRLLAHYPNAGFYIIGKAIGNQVKYLEELKNAFRQNVYFMDYVEEEKMDALFAKAAFSFILFKPYKFFFPVSGSLLYNLKKGNIVFTNNVNAVAEIVQDGENGFYLSNDLVKDTEIVCRVLEDQRVREKVRQRSYELLLEKHTGPVVESHFNVHLKTRLLPL